MMPSLGLIGLQAPHVLQVVNIADSACWGFAASCVQQTACGQCMLGLLHHVLLAAHGKPRPWSLHRPVLRALLCRCGLYHTDICAMY
jgi:hypothetical protein